ncbi:MAG: FIST C-terminal domain-containing protein [Chloroflexi bacterium]|nr:FIST C-terminal domain-containing protein [Chloroflexota bacterium]
MPTRIGVGLDNAASGIACGQNVARLALATLGNVQPMLALLFTSHPEPEQVLRGVNTILDGIPLIGATSAGEYSHAGYVEAGAGLMLVYSDHILFEPLTTRSGWFSFGRHVLGGNLRGLSDSGLGSPYRHRTLVLFPDEQSMNLNLLIEKAMTETALLYDILGGPGLASLTPPPRPPAVFFNDRLLTAGLTGAEVLSSAPVGLAISNGWSPVSGPYRVTRADDRRIIKIDGRPAGDVYEEFLRMRGIETASGIAPDILLKFPVGECQDRECKVSLIKSIERNGTLEVTAAPVTGSLIYILATQPDAMITAARRAIKEAEKTMTGQHPAGMLFIDCMSTAMALQDLHVQQRHAVSEQIGDIPFLGFRSYGVLARLSGQLSGHYACSVATFILPE